MYLKIRVSILIATTMTILGCAILPEFLREIHDEPAIIFKGMSLRNLSLFEATPVFSFKVTNPNPVSIKVRNIAYSLKINHKKFVKGVSDKGIRIKAVSSELLEVPVTFNYPDLFESSAEFAKSDKVAYDMSGHIGVGPYALPYHTRGEFELPAVPEVSLKNIEVFGLSSSGASMIFFLDVKNNNPFSVKVDKLDYRIKLGEKEFANGAVQNISPIEKKSAARIKILVNVSFLESGQSDYETLKASSSEYELSGVLRFYVRRLGEKIFPFQKAGNVILLKRK